MTAEELMLRYDMSAHIENGSYIERHYASKEEGRPASGMIYYYVAPGEKTDFHRIDCDEYWCCIEGSALELWCVDENGDITKSMLGTDPGCEPVVYFRKGIIFASRSFGKSEGTFLSCITVPRFKDDGFELFDREYMLKNYPQSKEFYE